MTVPFVLRFDLRNPAMAHTAMADRYAALLDMAEWTDERGGLAIVLSEHHGSDDGYLPSPLTMAAAIAARTQHVRISVAAIIAPFYDPLRLAEDLLVLDQLSRGRIDVVVAGGYVHEEFAMFGVPMRERPARVTEVVHTLKSAFTGEPFEYRGQTVRVTPGPYRVGGPGITLGGSSEAAARRAARIADGFIPSIPEVWEFYRDEVQRLGRPDPGPSPISDNRIVALAADAEDGWARMAPFFLHETNAYGVWQAQDDVGSPYRVVAGTEALRGTGLYSVLTPAQYIDELRAAPFPFAFFHPMCGGMPIDLAWESLRLFEHEVMPAFA